MDAKAKAQLVFDSVKAGRTVFTRAASDWMIVGPAADIHIHGRVTVTKADGTTVEVIVTGIDNSNERNGVRYTVATFRNTPTSAPETPGDRNEDANAEPVPARRTYRTVRGSVFGPGRVYSDEPGATYYRSPVSGKYTVQMWDED